MKTFTIQKVFFTLALSLSSYLSFSQSVNYKVIDDNPDKHNLFVALNVLDFNAYFADMSIGVNLYANAFIGKRLQAEFDFRKAYNDAGIGIFSPQDLTKSFQYRLGGQFNLVNKQKKANVKVVLSSYTSGRYQHSTFINAPGTYRRIFGVRGGIEQFYNNCRTDNGAQNSRAGNSSDMKAKLNGKVDFLVDPVNFETVNYSVNTFGIYGGISYRSIVDLLLDVDGYGKKGSALNNDFYADILISPLVFYTVKPNAKQAYLKDADLNISENSPNYLGWRIGWKVSMGRKFAFTAKSEVGQQTGNKAESWFINFGLGVGFNTLINKFSK